MFGLEDQKKKKPVQSFDFELENELKDSKKGAEIHAVVAKRLQTLKTLLQAGAEHVEYESLATILYGYQSLLKVFERVLTKKQKS